MSIFCLLRPGAPEVFMCTVFGGGYFAPTIADDEDDELCGNIFDIDLTRCIFIYAFAF